MLPRFWSSLNSSSSCELVGAGSPAWPKVIWRRRFRKSIACAWATLSFCAALRPLIDVLRVACRPYSIITASTMVITVSTRVKPCSPPGIVWRFMASSLPLDGDVHVHQARLQVLDHALVLGREVRSGLGRRIRRQAGPAAVVDGVAVVGLAGRSSPARGQAAGGAVVAARAQQQPDAEQRQHAAGGQQLVAMVQDECSHRHWLAPPARAGASVTLRIGNSSAGP